jgi:hypothetical protein
METSIFTDKFIIPDNTLVNEALGEMYTQWMDIRTYVLQKYPGGIEEWNFPGQKYGWSFRIKDKKRAIIYLLPRSGFFLVAFVYGEKATQTVMASDIATEIKEVIASAKVYAEGRGFRIEVRNDQNLTDIKKLIDIKLQY